MALPEFDADAVEVDEAPSCTFKLGGERWTCRGRDAIDVRTLQAFLTETQVEKFFDGALIPDDVDRFREMLRDENFTMPLARMQALMEFLAEEILEYPTGPRANSTGGPRPTKRTSGGVSPSRAVRRARKAG